MDIVISAIVLIILINCHACFFLPPPHHYCPHPYLLEDFLKQPHFESECDYCDMRIASKCEVTGGLLPQAHI